MKSTKNAKTRTVNSMIKHTMSVQRNQLSTRPAGRQAVLKSIYPSSLPHDVTVVLGQRIRDARDLATQFEEASIVAALDTLVERRRQARFRLAFVGEFKRGKSNLINRLVGRDLLPTGQAPTITSTISLIGRQQHEYMKRKHSDEHIESRGISREELEEILSSGDKESLAHIELNIQSDWLQATDVEVVDVPGRGDTNESKDGQQVDFFRTIDAAVVVVSATSPFSSSEQQFLENEILGNHVPRVLVAVSMLDTFSIEERNTIFASIQRKVARISPFIDVVPTYPLDSTQDEAGTLQAVRVALARLVRKEDRQVWRSYQVARCLMDQLDALERLGEQRHCAETSAASVKKEARRESERKLRRVSRHWDRLQLSLDQRRFQHTRAIRERMAKAKQTLIETLSFDLSRATDHKVWWERDFPYRLGRELESLRASLQQYLKSATAGDLDWLRKEVARVFKARPRFSSTEAIEVVDGLPAYQEIELANLKQYRMLTRLGGSAAGIGGFLLATFPVGMAASAVAVLVGEHMFNQLREKQRVLLQAHLEAALDQATDTICEQTSEHLVELCDQIRAEMQRNESAWSKAHHKALETTDTFPEQSTFWTQRIEEVRAMRARLEEEFGS